MSVRRAVVEADPKSMNVTAFCADHGISTWFFWDLRRRYAREGEAVLEPGSRAPHRVWNRTPADIEDLIVTARKQLDDEGLDNGPASIAFRLGDIDGVPSESTIWRILRARGLIEPEPDKAPKSTHRSFTAERANEVWAFDDWTWHLADGTPVQIFDVLDDHSRLAVGCTPMWTCTGHQAFEALAAAAHWLGWPQRFWSDNAKAFTEVVAGALAPLGIAASHTRPYSPNSNGKAERFHQTVRKWLLKQPRANSLDELTAQLDLFRIIYNTARPHSGIGRRFPANVWEHAPKTGPSTQPITATTRTHTATVINGTANAGRYRITIGAQHNDQTALTVITGTAAHVFITGRLIRALTLDPTRTRQTLHPKPGRPPTEREDPRHA